MIIASFLTTRKVYLYFLGDVLEIYKNISMSKKKIFLFWVLVPYIVLAKLSNKIAFVGKRSYERAPILFLKDYKDIYYLHAPIDTELFKHKNRKFERKKLNIPLKDPIILLTGKVTYMKGGDIFSSLVKSNPKIKFIAIGKWISKEIPRLDSNNLIIIDKVSNNYLPSYYSAADLSFAFHRQGDQMGIVGGESLACGTPIIHTKRIAFKDSPAIIKVSDSVDEINKEIQKFFRLSEKERSKIAIIAREYVKNNLSDEIWERKYINFYLS